MCKKNKKPSHDHFGLFTTKSRHYHQPTATSLARQVKHSDTKPTLNGKDKTKLSSVQILK